MSPSRQAHAAVVGNAAPLFLALWGWACVAVSLSARGPVVLLAGAGLAAAIAAPRALLFTLIFELVVFSAAIAVAPPDTVDFVWLGGALVGAGRAVRHFRHLRARASGE